MAVVDTNCDPDGIHFPFPANDDAGRALALYCDLFAKAAIDGIARGQSALGVDIGAMDKPAVEEALPAANDSEAFERLTAPRGAPMTLPRSAVSVMSWRRSSMMPVFFHYWQISAMMAADIVKLDADLKLHGRIERDGWIAQAKALMDAA